MLETAEGQVGAAVSAAPVNQPGHPVVVAEQYQVLAEDPDRHHGPLRV
jgi:hypothetical protein